MSWKDVLTEFCCYRMFQVQSINSNSKALSIRVSTQPLDQFCILVSINHTVDDSEFCYAQVGYLIVLVDVAAIGHPNSQIRKTHGSRLRQQPMVYWNFTAGTKYSKALGMDPDGVESGHALLQQFGQLELDRGIAIPMDGVCSHVTGKFDDFIREIRCLGIDTTLKCKLFRDKPILLAKALVLSLCLEFGW